eukprot:scaffold18231_cov112-Isochrysis_galbana.AAC.2
MPSMPSFLVPVGDASAGHASIPAPAARLFLGPAARLFSGLARLTKLGCVGGDDCWGVEKG